jgi:phosphonate transport system ATP-binding protein
VALARVLVQDPDLVLADEPVSSLDPMRADEVMRLLCETVTTPDRALLVSLHDFDLAVRRCDRVVGLRQGRIVFDLAAGEVDDRLRDQLYTLEPS